MSASHTLDIRSFDQATRCDVPVEQPMITHDTFRFVSGYVREICERFSPTEHQAEFSVRMDDIRQLAKALGQHHRQSAAAKLKKTRSNLTGIGNG